MIDGLQNCRKIVHFAANDVLLFFIYNQILREKYTNGESAADIFKCGLFSHPWTTRKIQNRIDLMTVNQILNPSAETQTVSEQRNARKYSDEDMIVCVQVTPNIIYVIPSQITLKK